MESENTAPPVRITVRPLASPMCLGFLALGGATCMLSGTQLGWFRPAETVVAALVLILFAFPLQFVAMIFGFLCRDAVAATGMGVLAATWMATGFSMLVTPPPVANSALGVLLVFAGVALSVPAIIASFDKLIPAAVLFAAAVRLVLSGVSELSRVPPLDEATGAFGLALLAIALYGALALGLEDARRATVVPVGRVGEGRAAMQGSASTQVARIEHEAGVRAQL